ncbi:Protein of unknown function [Gryllus bimaculatus]|nr:Protein of unknown function [Gryllus bimaculatus]
MPPATFKGTAITASLAMLTRTAVGAGVITDTDMDKDAFCCARCRVWMWKRMTSIYVGGASDDLRILCFTVFSSPITYILEVTYITRKMNSFPRRGSSQAKDFHSFTSKASEHSCYDPDCLKCQVCSCTHTRNL